MASLISFVYRGQTSASDSVLATTSPRSGEEARISLPGYKGGDPSSDRDADAPRSQFLPPGLSSSGSSEFAWAAPQFNSQDESEDATFVVDEQEQWLSSPFTPEGLLPRKSVDSMRRDLNIDIPPRTLEHSMLIKSVRGEDILSGVNKILARTDAQVHHPHSITSPLAKKNSHMHHDDQEYDESDDNMILPPPQYNLCSKSTFESSIQSPPISTSSFYSKRSSSGNRPVAMSPVLQVGHARTAVGALVALREAANRHPNTAMSLSVTNQDTKLPTQLEKNTVTMERQRPASKHHGFSMSVLPPRMTDFDNHDDFGVAEEEDSSSQVDENENAPYQSYASNVSTPNRSRSDGFQLAANIVSKTGLLLKGVVSQKGIVAQLHAHQDASAVDRYSQPSPTFSRSRHVSMGQKPEEQLSQDKASAPDKRTQYGAIASLDDSERFAYDENEEDFDRALMERKFRNQQLRKEQVVSEEQYFVDECFENDVADDLFEDEHDEYGDQAYKCDSCPEEKSAEEEIGASYNDGDKYAMEKAGCMGFEDALLRRKARNQRHEKEKLLHEVVARLRDNLGLVADIEAVASRTVATMGSLFVKTPIDGENMLTGFSSEQRNKLLSCIDSILNEMKVAQPEEFILSPSKLPVMAVSHDALTQAFCFCRELLVSAVPRDEKETMVKLL
jgi:hypothetical protein